MLEGDGAERVSITLCVLGNIDTEANRRVTAGLVPDFLVPSPADQAAEAIITGGLQRRREVYFPWHECVPVITLHFFFPTAIDQLLRSLAVK